MTGDEPELRRCLVAPPLAAEHPGLRLAWTVVEATPSRSPPELRARLRAVADRIGGAQAINLRHRDVPHAYRVFFRHVGLDPDVRRTPVEAIVARRMREGGLRSQDMVEDALAIAVLETGVGVWAFDAGRLTGAPTLRQAAAGRLVVADDAGPVAPLFDSPASRAEVTRETRRIALVAVAVPGVSELALDEAVWIAWDILR